MTHTPEIDTSPTTLAPEDSLVRDAELPLRGTFFPLGFPVEVITNSVEVLEAAAKSWNVFYPQFEAPPLVLKLAVAPDPKDISPPPPVPLFHRHGHLATHIADQHNFVSCDLDTGISFGRITEQTARSPLYLRYHIMETAILCMLSVLRVSALHAACVSANGYGMLFCGNSGAGKSSLAFAGARSGWTFISDDASYLVFDRNDHTIVGNCHQFRLRDSGALLFPELEGRPITARAAGKPSLEIPTTELPRVAKAQSAIVHALVFLNRQNVIKPELVSLSQDSVRPWFYQFPYTNTTSTARQLAAIDSLFDLPVYELRYTDLDWAIERLNQLTQHGT